MIKVTIKEAAQVRGVANPKQLADRMINRETGCGYARLDGSIVNNDPPRRSRQPQWRGAWIYCLKHFDYESAELIVSRNLVSDECSYQDHDLCHFSWCSCVHHSEVQFRAEHPQLKSLPDVQSERDEELEYAR